MVDDIIVIVMKKLGLEIPDYDSELDPTRNSDMTSSEMDWTIPTARVKEMKILYKKVCKPTQRKRKTFMYERDREEFPKKVKKEKISIGGNRMLETEIISRISNSDSVMGKSGVNVGTDGLKEENIDGGFKVKKEPIDETSQNSEITNNDKASISDREFYDRGITNDDAKDSKQNLPSDGKTSVI